MPHLSHSRLGVEAACPRKAYLSADLGLRPVVKSEALRLGAALADAHDIGLEEARAKMLAEHRKMQEAAKADPRLRAPSDDALEYGMTVVSAAHKGYTEAFGERPEGGVRELGYDAPVPFTEWTLVGYADLVVPLADGYDENGVLEVELIEDKLRARRVDVTALDQQLRFACWGLWAFHRMRVVKISYRQSIKPQIKQNSRTNESRADYLERVYERLASVEAHHETVLTAWTDAPDPATNRAITKTSIEQVPNELKSWAASIAQRKALGIHPPNTARCGDFGGCDYLALCNGRSGARQSFQSRAEREAAGEAPPRSGRIVALAPAAAAA